MIEIRGLTKAYGSFRAVDDLNLDVPTGQVLGLLGPNGAGKTTTIRMMTGYLPPTAGYAKVDGFDSLTESFEVRRRLGYLPESNPLYTEMRVEEYLGFRGRLFDLSRDEIAQAVDRVIERCWLTDMRRRLIGRLSKGYRQRVGLAAAMLHRPAVLVLDEPTSGLDPVQIRETRGLIRELAGDHTMILSSHILPEIERTCDRVVILAGGRVRADGTIDELRRLAGQTGRYVIELEGDADGELRTKLERVSGVRSVEVESSNGWTRFVAIARDGAGDLRAPLGRAIRDSNRVCRELSLEDASLENLFVRVTYDADGDADASSPPSKPLSNASAAAATTKGGAR
ncbi:MAG: ABC transporter ATP-binding protein [Phycisphaerales bacterium]